MSTYIQQLRDSLNLDNHHVPFIYEPPELQMEEKVNGCESMMEVFNKSVDEHLSSIPNYQCCLCEEPLPHEDSKFHLEYSSLYNFIGGIDLLSEHTYGCCKSCGKKISDGEIDQDDTLKKMLEIPKGKPRYLPWIDLIPTDVKRLVPEPVNEKNWFEQLNTVTDFIYSYPIPQYICKGCHKELPKSKSLSDITYSIGCKSYFGSNKQTDWVYGLCFTCDDRLFEIGPHEFWEDIERTSHLDFQDVEKEPVELSIDIDQCSDEEKDEVMNLLKEYKKNNE